MCNRLLKEYKGTDKVLTVNEMYAALATDVIMQYCFAFSYNFLDYPDFVSPFTTSISRSQVKTAHVAYHFPWFRKLLQSLPEAMVGVLSPDTLPLLQYKKVIQPSPDNCRRACTHRQ